MKAAKFYHTVSIFDILIARGDVLSGYARNEELVKALEENEFDNNFPMYFSWLKKRFDYEVQRQKLWNAAAKILSHLFALNYPSHPVTQNILRYLTDEDIVLCSNVLSLIV